MSAPPPPAVALSPADDRSDPPISAIVIFRDEREDLARCLPALTWCDELIAIRMAPSAREAACGGDDVRDDGSLELARRYATSVYHVEPHPIAEPTRVAASLIARNDWLLFIDPDEYVPTRLAAQMRNALAQRPDAGAFNLPMWFYFKGRRLVGTIWGALTYKRRLLHRERCEVLPWCNRLNMMRPGFDEITIDHAEPDRADAPENQREANHIRHYWSDSYADLLAKHIFRYSHTEAAAMAAEGQPFSLRLTLSQPFVELYRCLRHYDGWRLGPRGWALSLIYFCYVAASHALVAWYQPGRRSRRVNDAETVDVSIPPLFPDADRPDPPAVHRCAA